MTSLWILVGLFLYYETFYSVFYSIICFEWRMIRCIWIIFCIIIFKKCSSLIKNILKWLTNNRQYNKSVNSSSLCSLTEFSWSNSQSHNFHCIKIFFFILDISICIVLDPFYILIWKNTIQYLSIFFVVDTLVEEIF